VCPAIPPAPDRPARFVLLTALITAMSTIYFVVSQSIVSWYHIYSNFATISTVALALQMLPINRYGSHVLDRIYRMSVVASVVYLIATFAFVPYFYFVVFSPDPLWRQYLSR
jgi:hypothetical protein